LAHVQSVIESTDPAAGSFRRAQRTGGYRIDGYVFPIDERTELRWGEDPYLLAAAAKAPDWKRAFITCWPTIWLRAWIHQKRGVKPAERKQYKRLISAKICLNQQSSFRAQRPAATIEMIFGIIKTFQRERVSFRCAQYRHCSSPNASRKRFSAGVWRDNRRS
jgi:hypothetical protein